MCIRVPFVCSHRQNGGDVVVGLSLFGDATMTFEKEKGVGAGETRRVKLPRRALYVLSGKSRWEWTHAIPNDALEHERRVSITFRDVKPKK